MIEKEKGLAIGHGLVGQKVKPVPQVRIAVDRISVEIVFGNPPLISHRPVLHPLGEGLVVPSRYVAPGRRIQIKMGEFVIQRPFFMEAAPPLFPARVKGFPHPFFGIEEIDSSGVVDAGGALIRRPGKALLHCLAVGKQVDGNGFFQAETEHPFEIGRHPLRLPEDRLRFPFHRRGIMEDEPLRFKLRAVPEPPSFQPFAPLVHHGSRRRRHIDGQGGQKKPRQEKDKRDQPANRLSVRHHCRTILPLKQSFRLQCNMGKDRAPLGDGGKYELLFWANILLPADGKGIN